MIADKPALSSKTTVIPAAGTLRMALSGSNFFCTAATGPFKLSIDGDEELDWDMGFNFSVPGKTYRFLVFRNPNTFDITISYFTGNELVSYQAMLVKARNPETYMVALGEIPIGGIGPISPFNGADKQKQVIITNGNAAAQVYVMKGGTRIGIVFPLTTWTVETSDALEVVPLGFTCYYSQVFYKS